MSNSTAPRPNEDPRRDENPAGPAHTGPALTGAAGVLILVVLILLLAGEGAHMFNLPAAVAMVMMACAGVTLIIASQCWIGIDGFWRQDCHTAKVAEMNGRLEQAEKETRKLRDDVRQSNALLRQILQVASEGSPRAQGRVRMGSHLREVSDDTEPLPKAALGLDADVISLGHKISAKIAANGALPGPSSAG